MASDPASKRAEFDGPEMKVMASLAPWKTPAVFFENHDNESTRGGERLCTKKLGVKRKLIIVKDEPDRAHCAAAGTATTGTAASAAAGGTAASTAGAAAGAAAATFGSQSAAGGHSTPSGDSPQ